MRWKSSDVIGIVTGFSFDISLFDFFTALFFNVSAFVLSDTKNPFQCVREIVDFLLPLFFLRLHFIAPAP